ncbi:MAG: HAMP domain-containing histidine kinase [Planctomycetes bacterium]|nr:HAMP domain-containing histidine kinase [Planctomycetota bacterium]
MLGSVFKTTGVRTGAAIGVVALAMILAGLGLVLAIRQTQLQSNQRIASARPEAEKLAADLRDQVATRATEALIEVARGCRSNRKAHRPDVDPPGGERRPTWLGDLYYWNARELRHWPGLEPARGAPPAKPGRHQRVTDLVTGRLLSQLLLADLGPISPQALLLADTLDDEPIVLAYLVADAHGPTPFIVAAALDLYRLQKTFLEPLVTQSSDRIHLAWQDAPASTWSVSLGPGLDFWGLRPAPSFVLDQRRAVRRQTGIFVVITVLALVALLVVVWGLLHVVQREVALSQLKSSFVADVSHELKTPLALIHMFGETLAQGRVTSPEKRQEYYEIIQRESARLTHLINNILDFSRIEAGRKEYRLETIDVGAVVRRTYDSYRHDLDHNGFEHELRIAEGLPQVPADADAIAQALLNLMSNAVKYCDDERYLAIEVTPETRRGRHGVLIGVHDRGIGIPPEARRHLFDGFYRVSDERVRKQRGVGLGLALVKHIVEEHGGSIDVESRLVKGSTFRIFLPEGQEARGKRQEGPGKRE